MSFKDDKFCRVISIEVLKIIPMNLEKIEKVHPTNNVLAKGFCGNFKTNR